MSRRKTIYVTVAGRGRRGQAVTFVPAGRGGRGRPRVRQIHPQRMRPVDLAELAGRPGAPPMVFYDPTWGARQGLAALGTGRRLAWRYRAQLAPLALLGVLWAAGAAVHRMEHGLRTVLAVGPVLAGPGWLYGRRRWDRPVERRYAAGCGLAALGWLATCAAVGVDRPMPAVLWLAGCALAGPWWWHHRLRGVPTGPAESPVEQIWAERVAAPNRALPASTLSDVVKVGNGWSGTIQLPPGERSTDHALAATALVTSAFERPLGSVVIEATDDGVASRAQLLVLDRNPLHEVQHFTGPALDPATGLAPAGVYPDGQAGLFRFFQPGSGAVHFLVSGATGSGKSRFLDWVLVEATHSGLIVPWLGDPQGGQSLPRWVDHLDWAALSAPEILRMLRAATRVMAGRQRRLARAEWTDAHGRRLRGKQWFDPTPDMPLLLVVLDEAHDVLKNAEAVTLVEGIEAYQNSLSRSLTVP